MNTPIYDALLAEQEFREKLRDLVDGIQLKEKTLCESVVKPAKNWVEANPVVPWGAVAVDDPAGRVAWQIIRKPPEPTWRTFLRCLFWWLP